VSLDTLGTRPELLPALSSRALFAESQADLDAIKAAEAREDEAAKLAGRPLTPHQWHPDQESWLPAGLYNAMIAPLTPYSVKGFLWYQGEANTSPDRGPNYTTLFAGLIGDWRMHFAQGNLPFLFVQLASFFSPGENWGIIRDAQRRALAITNTAMAVTLDVGTAKNVHPPDKQTVGARLALAARGMVYGENVAYAPPLFRQGTVELADGRTAMHVWFDHAEGLTSRGKVVQGFELAGDDHHFVPAQARLQGDTVVLTSPVATHPKYVRYGWMGVVENSLFNGAGLPMAAFSSEENPTQ
jgi:sialate O-acetylesterase